MNYIKLDEFLENPVKVIDDTLEIDELTRISTDKGAVILMAENEFDYLMQTLANRKHVYNITPKNK